MSRPRPINVGIIGMGFMGRTHLAAYNAAAEAGYVCRVMAVADADESRRRGDPPESEGNFDTGASSERLFDPEIVRGYADAKDLLADSDVEVVSICTHTDTHVDLAIAALEAGKHVLVEKPVSITSPEVQRLVVAAACADTLCMPGMCMRFWPGWSWLRDRVLDGSLGRVRSAVFQRLGSAPAWATDFYRNSGRSGAALMDLHIHDTDFVYFCFGAPTSVSSTGSIDHLTTLYHYTDGPDHVIAEGGWDHTPGFDFRMRYVVVFDRATADFDLTRNPPLMLARDGESQTVELEAFSGYDGEIRHLLQAVREPGTTLDATIGDAVQVTHLLEAERESLSSRQTVAFAP